MKIVVIADTHGVLNELIRRYKNQMSNADIVFVLGDITNSEAHVISSMYNVPILGVHGNHDTNDTFYDSDIIDVDSTLYTFNNLTITGFQGSSRYKPSQIFGYDQNESLDHSTKLECANILISHDGPYGYCGDTQDDVHCGLKGINAYIKRVNPYVVFFGHHHKNNYFKINDTHCFCVYEIGIFNIDGDSISYTNLNL